METLKFSHIEKDINEDKKAENKKKILKQLFFITYQISSNIKDKNLKK